MVEKICWEVWVQYGALGLLIIVLGSIIIILHRSINKLTVEHKAERKDIAEKYSTSQREWKESSQNLTEKVIDVVDKNREALTRLTVVIEKNGYGR